MGGGTVCKGVVDVYPGEQPLTEIKLRPDRVNFVLGTELEAAEMGQILSRLGFDVETSGNAYQVTVPTFRTDITREIDLIEEIARVYGYDNIPTTLPKGDIPVPAPNLKVEVRRRIKRFLLAAGMMEAVNYSFCDPNCFEKIRLPSDSRLRGTLQLRNPLSPEMSVLRTTLVPGLLENTQHNRNHQINTIALFEIGSVFVRDDDQSAPLIGKDNHQSAPLIRGVKGFKEPERVTGVLAGQIGDGVYGNLYREPDFFDIKGLVEGMLEVCGITEYTLQKTDVPTFHPGRNAAVLLGETQVGTFGEAHPEVLENYDLPYKAYLFEFDLEALVYAAVFAKRFEPISIYPKVERDLAIVVDKVVLSDMPIELIYTTGGEWVESVRLFDVYEGEQVPKGKKSLAYTIVYHSAAETLTDKAVNGPFTSALLNIFIKNWGRNSEASIRFERQKDTKPILCHRALLRFSQRVVKSQTRQKLAAARQSKQAVLNPRARCWMSAPARENWLLHTRIKFRQTVSLSVRISALRCW